MMKAYTHTLTFKAKYCDVDFKDELKASEYLAVLEEVACSSAEELNLGDAFLKPRNYGFIVSATRCRFERPIRLGETFHARTWPLVPSFAACERQYQVLGENGEVAVNAASRWCLIDLKSGRLLSSKVVDNQDYSTYNTARALEVENWKIAKFDLSEGELRFKMTVANSEYDHYMHVNNTRYADYCFNCFSVEELSKAKLKEFAIVYVRQCREGDELFFYRKPLGNGEFLVQGVNGTGEVVASAEIRFDE